MAAGERVGDGECADEQRPLIHLGRDQRPQPGAGAPADGQQTRDQELRRFGGDRRDHLDQQELVDPQGGARRDQPPGEGLRHGEYGDCCEEKEPGNAGVALGPRQHPCHLSLRKRFQAQRC